MPHNKFFSPAPPPGDGSHEESISVPEPSVLLIKARWGKDGGLGGTETHLRASQGGFLPPNKQHSPQLSGYSCADRRL